jgi:serine/threonine protein kinase
VVIEEPSEGGFGVVYRSQQLALDRAVALEVLEMPAGLTAQERTAFPEAFRSEARTSARLKHPHIVEVHDFGVTPWPGSGPLHWMALEWLEGRTLEDFLEHTSGRRLADTALGRCVAGQVARIAEVPAPPGPVTAATVHCSYRFAPPGTP